MSQGSVEIARRALDAFNAGDFDAATAEMASDIEWRPVGAMALGEVLVGTDEVKRFWREWQETFEDFHLVIDDLFEAPVGAVAVTRATGKGVASGIEVTGEPFFQVFEIRDDLVRSLRMLTSRREAMEAAGISQG